jgi:autotransporter passenger strand-loop-strand repeat protein
MLSPGAILSENQHRWLAPNRSWRPARLRAGSRRRAAAVAGGTASAAIIGSGGLEAVFGIDRGGTISGGTQYDYGTVSGGVIVSAGEQIVEAGAVASNMTVDSGGLEYLVFGGTAATTISGGTLEVTSGASGWPVPHCNGSGGA